jgi:hypothetical protein
MLNYSNQNNAESALLPSELIFTGSSVFPGFMGTRTRTKGRFYLEIEHVAGLFLYAGISNYDRFTHPSDNPKGHYAAIYSQERGDNLVLHLNEVTTIKDIIDTGVLKPKGKRWTVQLIFDIDQGILQIGSFNFFGKEILIESMKNTKIAPFFGLGGSTAPTQWKVQIRTSPHQFLYPIPLGCDAFDTNSSLEIF